MSVTPNLQVICHFGDISELSQPSLASQMAPRFYFLNSTQRSTTLVDIGQNSKN